MEVISITLFLLQAYARFGIIPRGKAKGAGILYLSCVIYVHLPALWQGDEGQRMYIEDSWRKRRSGMRTFASRIGRVSAFTLIELMIVVVIVAILALVAIPLYRGNVTAAKMSEGIAGCGTIRTALRVYAASHAGNYPGAAIAGKAGSDAAFQSVLGINSTDLQGKYFDPGDYAVVTCTAANYTVRATANKFDATMTYIINDAGAESGTYTTGN
jgi:type IV pilus assembly protein PilE